MTQISYLGFCALGALTNPHLSTRAEYVGTWYVGTSYWYRD